MSEAQCGMCGGRSDDAFICRHCTDQYRSRLVGGNGHGSVGQLVGQLDLTLSRQAKVGGLETGVRSKSSTTALAFNLSASDALVQLHGAVMWAAEVSAPSGKRTLTLTDAGRSAEAHGWALVCATPTWLHHLAQHKAAAEVVHAVTGAAGRGWAVIDKPPETQFAGPCDSCGADLYATAGSAQVTCAHCEASYDLAGRRRWLLARVEDRLLTAVEASRALPGLLERDLSVDTVRSWIHRNRVLVRGYLHNGQAVHARLEPGDQPLLRVGDLIDMVNTQRRADDGRRRKKAS